MKKRIKLTEKELAIGMWLYIKQRIMFSEQPEITSIKREYMLKHHASTMWQNFCILCDKHVRDCSSCPLGSCNRNRKTPWAVVTNYVHNLDDGTYYRSFTLEERLDACDKIIEAIEKDIPDDYVNSRHEQENRL